MIPNCVNGELVALGKAVHFQPLDRFFVSQLRSFSEKKTADTPQSLPQPHYEGTVCQ